MKKLAVLIFVVAFRWSAGSAESISLDHVTGLDSAGALLAGAEVTFHLAASNQSTYRYDCIYSGFRIFSEDGAEWAYPWADTIIDTILVPCPLRAPDLCATIDTTILYARVLPAFSSHFLRFCINHFGLTGSESDTTSFGGFVITPGEGLPAGWDDLAYELIIQARLQDTGRHICLDSSWAPPGGTWKWASVGHPCIGPEWDGPHCFLISPPCCVGMRGNVDNDPSQTVDISDVTRLIDYLFISYTQPQCMEEANADGDPAGTVDISDLTRLISYLFIPPYREPEPCP